MRFSDGQIAQLTAASSGSITLGRQPDYSVFGAPKPDGSKSGNGYFRADYGTVASIEQVLLIPSDASTFADEASIVGRLLASTGFQTGTLDIYPQGVGLALNGILDSASIVNLPGDDQQRALVVDSKTTLADIFTPFAKEYGWFLIWDPLLSKYAGRTVRIPAAPNSSDVAFTESNRTNTNDRTSATVDNSTLRSAWTLRWGWNRWENKFLSPDITLTDAFVLSAFGTSAKQEKIEDKTLPMGGNASGLTLTALMLSRSYLYRQPWLRCKRTMSKAGLLIAPGSSHQIIDNTIPNPFSATGLIGITAADRVYVMVTGVSMNPATGQGDITFFINRQDPSSVFRVLSPCALVDFAAATHGYNTGTGVLTFVSHYASDGVSLDGIDFSVGDTVTLLAHDVDGTPAYQQNTTISAVAGDGHTATVASGLPAFPATTDVVMVLRDYANATATRQGNVAFQGSYTGKIQNVVVNHRWL